MIAAVAEFLRAPRVTAALTTTGAGLIALAFAAQQLIGWPGYIAALVLLDLLLVASLVARREETRWNWAILPISLVAYVAWISFSVLWSEYQRATLASAAYLLMVTLVGVYVGLSRDTIQVIRSLGDVLRAVLLASIVLEVASGIIFDGPIRALNIDGELAFGGPISGLMSTRNQLGLVAAIALVTFVIEWRTRSIRRSLALASAALAVATMVFTQSPVVAMVAVVLFAATAVLYTIRRIPPGQRLFAQYTVLGLLVVAAALAWVFRGAIIAVFNANGELALRLTVWQRSLDFVGPYWLEGWGWLGTWNPALPPYSALTPTFGRPHDSALNALVDLWLQIGVVGVVIFLAVVGLAFVRSWLLAGRRRSVVYTWPALVLVALIVVSTAESAALTGFGWLLLVICCVKASQELSWRRALGSSGDEDPAPSRSPVRTDP